MPIKVNSTDFNICLLFCLVFLGLIILLIILTVFLQMLLVQIGHIYLHNLN